MKRILLPILCLILLVGCIPAYYQQPQMSSSQMARERAVETVNGAFSRAIECGNNLREGKLLGSSEVHQPLKDAAKIVDQEILVRNDSAPNKLELLSSTAKMTPKQKKALLDLLTAAGSCRKALTDGLSGYPSILAAVNSRYGDNDITYSKLISRKITIGDANQEMAQTFIRYSKEYNAATGSLDNQFNAQINREYQAAQAEEMQRRAIAAQYLMNQQAINAAQQINNQNQINNNRPRNTSCNRYGNTIDCTTY